MSHAILPHHHHYHASDIHTDNCKSEKHNSEEPDLHCYAFNDLIVEKSNPLIKKVEDTGLSHDFILTDNLIYSNTVFLNANFYKRLYKDDLIFFLSLATYPTRGSPCIV